MKEKIERLREFSIAHKIALNFDYVPNPDSLEEVWEYVQENMDLNISKEDLDKLLEDFSGYDTRDLENEVFDLIDEL
jgi:hypothetical protein